MHSISLLRKKFLGIINKLLSNNVAAPQESHSIFSLPYTILTNPNLDISHDTLCLGVVGALEVIPLRLLLPPD